MTVNLGVDATSTGGSSGNLNIDVATPITTHGGDAVGVLAQSIGGGGGLGGLAGSDGAADNPIVATNNGYAEREFASEVSRFLQNVFQGDNDGSNIPSIDPSYTQSIGGAGAQGGIGGNIEVAISAPITPSGDGASGVIAQSIGGGKGGTAAATGTGGLPEITINSTVALGGSGGAGNSAGEVFIDLQQGAAAVRTAGYAASGIIAQSIGGGMGADGSDSATGVVTLGQTPGGAAGSCGTGGTVQFEYGDTNGSTVATTGVAADAIVLQTVGSGGIGGAGSSLFLGATQQSTRWMLTAGRNSGSGGDGGTVLMQQEPNATSAILNVSTQGAYAIGLLAQSIGSGGPISVQPTAETVTATLGGQTSSGDGHDITINANNVNLSTQGIAAHGVVAQSLGGGGYIRLNDTGTAVASPALTTTWTASYTSNLQQGAGGGGNVNVSLIGGGVTVTGAGAVGILAQSLGGGGVVLVRDGAIFAGSAASTSGSCVNACTGGGDVTALANGNVTASGTNGIAIFAQSQGSSGANGTVAVTVSATVTGGGGTAATATQPGAAGVRIDGDNAGNTLSLTPHSTFAPAGVALNANQGSLANYLTRAWKNADAAFAAQFAAMSDINTAAGYLTTLDQLSGRDIQAQSIALANAAGSILGASMNCPVFLGQSVLLGEGNCAWATVSGRRSDQGTTATVQGYDVDTMSYRIGAQHEIAPDWYLGGSLAYGDTSSSTDNGSWGDGYTLDGSIALKHLKGPWFFAGALAIAYGSFTSHRQVNLPAGAVTLESDPSMFLAGARLRAGYEFTFDTW